MDNSNSIEEGKTIAIISYITIVGLIIAIVMNKDKNNEFAQYHIRQSLGIILLYVVVWMVFLIISTVIYFPLLSTIIYLGLLVLWILGVITALQGEKKAVPLVGEHFQKWFHSVG